VEKDVIKQLNLGTSSFPSEFSSSSSDFESEKGCEKKKSSNNVVESAWYKKPVKTENYGASINLLKELKSAS
jgi:hypothetical protein